MITDKVDNSNEFTVMNDTVTKPWATNSFYKKQFNDNNRKLNAKKLYVIAQVPDIPNLVKVNRGGF